MIYLTETDIILAIIVITVGLFIVGMYCLFIFSGRLSDQEEREMLDRKFEEAVKESENKEINDINLHI